MRPAILEKASECVTDSVDKTSRAASAVAGTLGEGLHAAKRAASQGREAASDLLDDASRQIRRNPIGMAVGAFTVGATIGLLVGLMTRRA